MRKNYYIKIKNRKFRKIQIDINKNLNCIKDIRYLLFLS